MELLIEEVLALRDALRHPTTSNQELERCICRFEELSREVDFPTWSQLLQTDNVGRSIRYAGSRGDASDLSRATAQRIIAATTNRVRGFNTVIMDCVAGADRR